MTFKDVVIKNFKHNIKTYSSFFMCSTFTITLFFIFTTLLYNDSVVTFLKNAGFGADVVLYVALIITSLFAVFFISYVHSSMKKSRGKEFGLLMTLGMTAGDLNKIIVLEDIILSCVSLLSGIFMGTLFSRLIHMLMNRLLELQVPYSLSYKSFVITFIAFFIIFSVVMCWGYIRTRSLSISYLLKQQRSTEYTGNGSRPALAAGAIMILLLVLDGLAAIKNRDVALNMKLTMASVVSGLIGVYILIANLFPKMLAFIKKRKRFYNRNLVMLTEVKHSMGKNKRLIYMSALLCTVIIHSFSSSLGLYSITENIADKSKGADIEYIESGKTNNFSEEGIKQLLKEESLSLKNKEDIQCLFLKVEGIKLDYPLPAVAVAESSYNKCSSGKTQVPGGSVRLAGDEINLPRVTGDAIELQVENNNVKLKLLEPENLPMLSTGTYKQDKFVLVLNDVDYNRLEASMPKAMAGTIHRYYFEDWRATKDLYNKLAGLSAGSKAGSESSGFTESLGISGKYYGYQLMKKLYSIFIFIFMFLSLLFFVASVLMLLLRQFEALDRTRRKYRQLRKIGITKKEFGKAVLGETRIIFITPVAFGVILAFSFMLIVESMVGGAELVNEFMSKAVVLTTGYVILQFIACELSGRRFLNRVIEE